MTTPEHDELRTGRSVTGPAEPTQAEIRAGKETEAALGAQPPTDRPRVPGAFYPPAGVQVTVDAEHLLKDAPVPAGWDRIEGGAEDDWTGDASDDEAERALRMLELTNERADIDLERDKLAHARLVASDGLRLEALHTAREIVRGYKYASPAEQTARLEQQYRRILALLEEPDPAAGAVDTEDGQAG